MASCSATKPVIEQIVTVRNCQRTDYLHKVQNNGLPAPPNAGAAATAAGRLTLAAAVSVEESHSPLIATRSNNVPHHAAVHPARWQQLLPSHQFGTASQAMLTSPVAATACNEHARRPSRCSQAAPRQFNVAGAATAQEIC